MPALSLEIEDTCVPKALRCRSKSGWELGRDGAQWSQATTPTSLIDALSNSGIDRLPVHAKVTSVIDGGNRSTKVNLVYCCYGHFDAVVEVLGLCGISRLGYEIDI